MADEVEAFARNLKKSGLSLPRGAEIQLSHKQKTSVDSFI
jgi:hypothetical protein